MFRSDNCLTTFQPSLSSDHSAAAIAIHNDRFLAFVPSKKAEDVGGPTYFHFWDTVLAREITRYNLFEPIRGLRISPRFLVTVLEGRTVAFQYQTLDKNAFNHSQGDQVNVGPDEVITAPNRPHSLHVTGHNPFALACLHDSLLILPAQSPGQLQLILLKPHIDTSTKRVLRAHKSAIRCMALSPDGQLLGTASEQGTLIRVFDTSTLDQVFEFRRGMDAAIIHSIAFSPEKQWLACTSDKGTLHVFNLRPASTGEHTSHASPTTASSDRPHRRTESHHHRPSAGGFIPPPPISNLSSAALSVTPSTAIASPPTGTSAGSIQEYYHLLPHAGANTASAGTTSSRGLSGPTLRPSPFTPRIFTDARSTASAPFYIGNDPTHWQNVGSANRAGESLYSWTVTPGGGRKRVKKPVRPLPNDPQGRPPKGVVAFEDETVLYVVGGGGDARWEKFELTPVLLDNGATEWRLVCIGFRKYLSKQYVD